jgi:hypothetical protein
MSQCTPVQPEYKIILKDITCFQHKMALGKQSYPKKEDWKNSKEGSDLSKTETQQGKH